MRIRHSRDAAPLAQPVDGRAVAAAEGVAEPRLRGWVDDLAVPRSFRVEPDANRATADALARELESFGYSVRRQGRWDNVVASFPDAASEPVTIVGAHYDSVPRCPAADDNASALAALLGVAETVAAAAPRAPVSFVAWNREEDGIEGSLDFVREVVEGEGLEVRVAHVLEMVGYRDLRPGSQRVPPGLPIRLPRTGDFLGLVADRRSAPWSRRVLSVARRYHPAFPVLALEIPFGLERVFPVVLRSDHSRFWEAGLPAVMWTDTSEYRNPHYHRPTDVPDTLDYDFLRRVTQLLMLTVLAG